MATPKTTPRPERTPLLGHSSPSMNVASAPLVSSTPRRARRGLSRCILHNLGRWMMIYGLHFTFVPVRLCLQMQRYSYNHLLAPTGAITVSRRKNHFLCSRFIFFICCYYWL